MLIAPDRDPAPLRKRTDQFLLPIQSRSDKPLLESLSVRGLNCVHRAAVAIEPSLQPQSPENGNIRDVGWRLSAIRPTKNANWEGGDWRRVRGSPPLVAFSGAPTGGTTYGGVTGWGGRDRTSEWRIKIRLIR